MVKTPAAIASVSDKIRVKSGVPDGFNPAAIPAALNPFGAVTPPLMTCQSTIGVKFLRIQDLIIAS